MAPARRVARRVEERRMAHNRVSIVGASGQLGNDLLRAFAGCEVTALDHAAISIEDPGSVRKALGAVRPDLVLNAAAFHKVPLCETQQMQAMAVNALGVRNLAEECARLGASFGTVSTDYVFDGTKGAPYSERDEPHPLSVYGLSKLAGEMMAAAATPSHYIFRTSGLFGRLGSKSKGYTFIDRILAQARAGEPVRVVDDMTFSPSYTRDVARWIRRITDAAPFGIYHVTNSGACTWYEFALETLRQAGLERADLSPISSASWTDGVRRPKNSALAHDALLAAGIDELPSWQAAIGAFLAERALPA